MDVGYELRLLEASPGDMVILSVPDKVIDFDAQYLIGLKQDLADRGHQLILLCNGERLETISDEGLAMIAELRLENQE